MNIKYNINEENDTYEAEIQFGPEDFMDPENAQNLIELLASLFIEDKE